MKKCFTINPLRKTSDFAGYQRVLAENLFQAIEIFYPEDEAQRIVYAENVHHLIALFPQIEVLFHLPFNRQNDLCLFAGNEELIKKFKSIMDFASQFKVKKLTMHLGYVNPIIERNVYFNHLIRVLKDLCAYALKLKMILMIENMPDKNQMGYAPEEILNIIKAVGTNNLRFIYDTGHAHVSEFSDLLYLEVLGDYLSHCHLNDNNGLHDQHLSFGKGNIDFQSFFLQVALRNYQGCFCLEIIFNDEFDLRENAKKFDLLTNLRLDK
jgi:sugar phosphate isomerase/epimerase